MAKKLDKFPVPHEVFPVNDEWFDGSPWELRAFADYSCSCANLSMAVHSKARSLGGICQFLRTSWDRVAIQFFKSDVASPTAASPLATEH